MGTACRDQPSVPPVQWVDVAIEAGVHFTHYNDARGQYHYVETFGSGAAFLDYDGDGYYLDLYLVNGAPIDSALSAAAPTNQLYHNGGNGLFEARSAEAGAGDRGYGMGVSAADYDGDGDTDLYVTNWGPNALYRNDGAQFTNVTQPTGVGDLRWGTERCVFRLRQRWRSESICSQLRRILTRSKRILRAGQRAYLLRPRRIPRPGGHSLSQ